MVTRPQIIRRMNDYGISAAAFEALDSDYKVLTKASFVKACNRAVDRLDARGLWGNRMNQSWECNHRAMSVYAELIQFHALNYKGDAALAVGVMPFYWTMFPRTGHVVVFGIVDTALDVCLWDQDKRQEIELTDEQKSFVPTYLF